MLPQAEEGASGPSVLERLRIATAPAHAALENGLALLRPPLSRARFVEALQGFYAFHAVWEPWVAALVDDDAWLAPRRRLSLLERDLAALGARPDGRRFGLDMPAERAAAWGSLYVVEGSTLGGQVIDRALRRTDWAPAGGLRYFDPHGRETGALWRSFRARLEREADGLGVEGVVAGAQATFRTLRRGLVSPAEALA